MDVFQVLLRSPWLTSVIFFPHKSELARFHSIVYNVPCAIPLYRILSVYTFYQKSIALDFRTCALSMVKDKIWRKIARINHSINRSAKEKMPSKIFTISHVTRLISSIFTTNLTGMIHPEKLSPGDEIRVISPARSLRLISEEVRSIANQRFSQMGLILTFGKHVYEIDDAHSSSLESRLEDLHEAFRDPKVKAIITVIGGFNSNQLLDSIDWALIKKNPKIFCGFSDITALSNAMLAKTGLVTYYGPHYSSFGQKLHFDYTLDGFVKATMKSEPYNIFPSNEWSDDLWFKNQDSRKLIKNQGFFIINEGKCEGKIIGGNVTALVTLKGTPYFPNLSNSILFLEDDEEVLPHHFDRLFCSLIQLPEFADVKGIVIGRFQNRSKMTNEELVRIIKTKAKLSKIPIIAGVDFGHTDPKCTFPIGGTVKVIASKKDKTTIEITD